LEGVCIYIKPNWEIIKIDDSQFCIKKNLEAYAAHVIIGSYSTYIQITFQKHLPISELTRFDIKIFT